MSILAWIEDQRQLKILNAQKHKQPTFDGSRGLWIRCDFCGLIIFVKHLKHNQYMCFGCDFHFRMTSQQRIDQLIDSGSWRPLDETLSPCDPLGFKDKQHYIERLNKAQDETRLQDAVQTGTGMMGGMPIAFGVMDFDFMGGSMGSVVGEKITRLIEYATQEGLLLLLVCASGGARMQEGIFSLMQMAKISSALHIHQSYGNLPYLSVLTSPTTGGVTASFAMLGDLVFAEPKAVIGFAGRRVIEQTLREELPSEFQTSEYLLNHGLLTLIVQRYFLKQALSETIALYSKAFFKRPGLIPHGVQKNLGLVSEERARRLFNNWQFPNTCERSKMSDESSLLTSNNPSNSLPNLENVREQVHKKEDLDYKKNLNQSPNPSFSFASSLNESLSDFSYREILINFQTIFDFFSIDPLPVWESELSYAVSEKEDHWFKDPNNFLEDSISLAKTEIIEWRASYITQKYQVKLSFLKDLKRHHLLKTDNGNNKKTLIKQSLNQESDQKSDQIDNKFFYRIPYFIDYNLAKRSFSEELVV